MSLQQPGDILRDFEAVLQRTAALERMVASGVSGSVLGDLTHIHSQAAPLTVWMIPHAMGKFPNVQVFTSAGDEVEGDIHHTSNMSLTVTFSAAFAGVAYLN